MAAIREQKNLRFAAATMAMNGLLSDQTLVASPEEIIEQAVTYADLLITRLNKPEDAEAKN